jgi:hypothetical protein
MPQINGKFDDDNLEAPAKLVIAFRELPSESVFIPPTLDEAVWRAARKHLVAAPKTRSPWFRFVPWAFAVAMLTLVLFVAQFFMKPISKSRVNFAREDLNQDGQVDILDAFTLACQLKSGSVTTSRLDLNGDGIVDDRDVATIARHAVKLEKGGRS